MDTKEKEVGEIENWEALEGVPFPEDLKSKRLRFHARVEHAEAERHANSKTIAGETGKFMEK